MLTRFAKFALDYLNEFGALHSIIDLMILSVGFNNITGKIGMIYSLHATTMKLYRVEAVGLKSSNYTLKKYDLCGSVKFGAISQKKK